MPDETTRTWFRQYGRALRFVLPYSGQLAAVTLVGLMATATGLMQPYFSKLLIDSALLRRDMRALVWVAGLMAGFTIAGFVLNIVSSYQYVRISAHLLFELRLRLYRHLQACSPRFWTRNRLGDVVSRINNDAADVQRITADTLLGICSNVVFLLGAAAIMMWFSLPVFLCSVATLPLSIWALRRYQALLSGQEGTQRGYRELSDRDIDRSSARRDKQRRDEGSRALPPAQRKLHRCSARHATDLIFGRRPAWCRADANKFGYFSVWRQARH